MYFNGMVPLTLPLDAQCVYTLTWNEIYKMHNFIIFWYLFQVMVQKHNRNSPMSLHLATIAISDSILLAIGELCYLHPLK